MNAFHNLPATRPNLRTLGLPNYQPVRLGVVAPRASDNISPARVGHVMLLIASMLNIEEAADRLKDTPRFSSLLQDDLNRMTKLGRLVNLRFMAEFSEADARHVDTMNKAGNLLKRLSQILFLVPEEVAEEAANAAADVVEKHRAATLR